MVQFPPGRGMVVVWLELIRLPSFLAAYQGFIILSLLQQGRGGVCVCVQQILHSRGAQFINHLPSRPHLVFPRPAKLSQ